FVDHGFQWDGVRNVWLTRARACFIIESGPAFDLRPRSLWKRFFGLSWRQAAIDPYFDEFFALRTPSPAETWDALATRARTLMVGSFEDGCLVSDGRHVTLWREADFGREADAEAAVELVSEIVSFRAGVMEPLRRLPGATYAAASGPWHDRRPPHVELPGPAPVRMVPVAVDGGPVLVGRAGRGGAPGGGRLPAGVSTAAREGGGSALRCEGSEVALYWDHLATGRERLMAGANRVSSLSSGQIGGRYR